MVFSSTCERSFWFILGLSTFLALVGFSVSIWSIGSLKYQIEYSKEQFSTVNKLNTIFKESLSKLNTTVNKLQGQ